MLKFLKRYWKINMRDERYEALDKKIDEKFGTLETLVKDALKEVGTKFNMLLEILLPDMRDQLAIRVEQGDDAAANINAEAGRNDAVGSTIVQGVQPATLVTQGAQPPQVVTQGALPAPVLAQGALPAPVVAPNTAGRNKRPASEEEHSPRKERRLDDDVPRET